MLIYTAARMMHKYNAHAATDVTGFGLLGHAQNLAAHQKNEVAFVIHNLPVIAKMAAVAKACGNMFQLMQGLSAETSGNFCSKAKDNVTLVFHFNICLFRRYVDLSSSRASCRLLQRHRKNGRLSSLDHWNR